jgi:WhiB family redox-sensing transcriptional regulator
MHVTARSVTAVGEIERIEEPGVVEALMLSTGPMPNLRDLLGRPAWQANAACRGEGVELFFPPENTSLMEARRICNRCTVADQCLQFALERPSLKGVWAGTSERHRRRLRTHRLGIISLGEQTRPVRCTPNCRS